MILWGGSEVRMGGLAWISMHTSVATAGVGGAPFRLLLPVALIQAEVVQEE